MNIMKKNDAENYNMKAGFNVGATPVKSVFSTRLVAHI
jgi:hypothetical protein